MRPHWGGDQWYEEQSFALSTTLLVIYCAVELAVLHFMDASWGCHGTPSGEECNTSSGPSFTSCLSVGHRGHDSSNQTHIKSLLIWRSSCLSCLHRGEKHTVISVQTCSASCTLWACHDLIVVIIRKYGWVQTDANIVNTVKPLNAQSHVKMSG